MTLDTVISTSRNHSCQKPTCYYCNWMQKGEAIKPIWGFMEGVRLVTDNRERQLEKIYEPAFKA